LSADVRHVRQVLCPHRHPCRHQTMISVPLHMQHIF
jgi:hypothetical protein